MTYLTRCHIPRKPMFCPVADCIYNGEADAEIAVPVFSMLLDRHRLPKPLCKTQKGYAMPNILTCVYCGMQYPEGTPPHGSQILTDHIKVCEEHPLRQAEVKIAKLRNALIGLVGASESDELERMEAAIRLMPVAEQDRANTLNAIHAIKETA